MEEAGSTSKLATNLNHPQEVVCDADYLALDGTFCIGETFHLKEEYSCSSYLDELASICGIEIAL
jgi:hypothetical protein